jgi:predicted nucleic acid-binding protein
LARFIFDSSVMIAAVSVWHGDHDRAAAEIERRLAAEETLIVPAPAVVETYSVLTRLPAPHRLAANDALTLIEANFLLGEVVALQPDDYRELLRQAPPRSIVGGQTYDAVIVACARASRADTLLTFNVRHFQRIAPEELKIVVPNE